jgi:type I restriction enzyme M protein
VTINRLTAITDKHSMMHATSYKVHMTSAASTSKPERLLRDGRRTEKLRNLVTRIFYPGHSKRRYIDPRPSAIPFLGGTNISQLLTTTDKWLSETEANIENVLVKPGWILVTRSGSTGIIATVPKIWAGYAISEHVIRIIPDDKKLSGSYIYAFLKTEYAQDIIKRGVFGSLTDHISPIYLGDMDVPLPKDDEEAHAIIQLVKDGESARLKAMSNLSIASKLFSERILDSDHTARTAF